MSFRKWWKFAYKNGVRRGSNKVMLVSRNTRAVKNLCLVYLSITPPDLSTYSVDTLLLTFLNFARFSVTTTLNISVQNIKYTATWAFWCVNNWEKTVYIWTSTYSACIWLPLHNCHFSCFCLVKKSSTFNCCSLY